MFFFPAFLNVELRLCFEHFIKRKKKKRKKKEKRKKKKEKWLCYEHELVRCVGNYLKQFSLKLYSGREVYL